MPNWRKGVQGPQRRPRAHLRRTIAARRIQRAFRSRKGFRKNVNRAVLTTHPMQYRLYGIDRSSVSQAPTVLMNLSNLKASTENTEPMYLRASRKIKPMSWTMRFRADYQDAPFNQMCFALIRHKRSDPVVSADINNGLGALTTSTDKPFLPLDDAGGYNENVTNMTGVSTFAHPSFLLKYFNPKVVDVLKTWTVNVQPTTQDPNQNFTPFREWTYTHRFKGETWKYPEIREGTVSTPFPYNNKCYAIVGWSDSVAATSHPEISIACRFSFKDLD